VRSEKREATKQASSARDDKASKRASEMKHKGTKA
jgi:hypothetical protein